MLPRLWGPLTYGKGDYWLLFHNDVGATWRGQHGLRILERWFDASTRWFHLQMVEKDGRSWNLLKSIERAQGGARRKGVSNNREIDHRRFGQSLPYRILKYVTSYWLLLDEHPKAARTHYHYLPTQKTHEPVPSAPCPVAFHPDCASLTKCGVSELGPCYRFYYWRSNRPELPNDGSHRRIRRKIVKLGMQIIEARNHPKTIFSINSNQ